MNRPLILLALALVGACKQKDDNLPPSATVGGPTGSVPAGTWVQLEGEGSTDPEAAAIHYRWEFVRLPLGSFAELNDPTVQNPSFLADVAGDYVVGLVVDDGFLRSAPAEVTIVADAVNGVPIADAGFDRGVVTGNDVLLDGSASYDPDEDPLTFAWEFVQRPSGSTAAFDDPSAEAPTFTADLDGDYVVRLLVSDGTATSAPYELTVHASLDNIAPIANAGVDQATVVGDDVTLSGDGSYDPNGAALTYTWTFTERPTGSAAAITQDGTDAASFTVDVAGSYRVALVVDDGSVVSAPDEALVTATFENLPPVPDAGADQAVTTGTAVRLDASATTDADGDTIAYQWSFWDIPTGSRPTFNDPNVVKPTFTPDVDGEYTLRLDTFDGIFFGPADFVTITASGGNLVPIADAGDAQTVGVADIVALDGSGSSDADLGDLLSYDWRFLAKPAGSLAMLNDPTLVNPSFIADRMGTYRVELVVSDGALWSALSEVEITVTVGNVAPATDAGPPQSVTTGSIVQLDGSATLDADGDPVTYDWAFLSVPAGFFGGLNDASVVNPSFIPTVNGDYVAQLRTFDGSSWGPPDTVTITASNGNVAPVANAGADAGVDTGTLARLDGTGSTDANSTPLTYSWAFVSKPAGSLTTLNDSMIDKPSFVPDVDGAYVVRLWVSDGTLSSASDTVTLTAGNGSTTPTADAGADLAITTGAFVTLDGAASADAESDPLTYAWAFTALPTGSLATLNDTSVVAPSFVSDVNGTYSVRLRVFDGQFWSAPDDVDIVGTGGNSAPVANAGPDATRATGLTAQVDAVGSTDADSDPLAFEWQFTALPAGSAARLNDARIRNPSFVCDRAGTYVLRLRVFDGRVWSTADFVTITAS